MSNEYNAPHNGRICVIQSPFYNYLTEVSVDEKLKSNAKKSFDDYGTSIQMNMTEVTPGQPNWASDEVSPLSGVRLVATFDLAG